MVARHARPAEGSQRLATTSRILQPAARILRQVTRILAFSTLGLCMAIGILVGVINLIDYSRPITWGTFTAERCIWQAKPWLPCTSAGSWRSDDGTLVLTGVTLDGVRGDVSTTRAGVRVGGLMGQGTVHTAEWIDAGLWMPGLIVVGIVFIWLVYGPSGIGKPLIRLIRRRSRNEAAPVSE